MSNTGNKKAEKPFIIKGYEVLPTIYPTQERTTKMIMTPENRDKFIELVQKCSVLNWQNLPQELTVTRNGAFYYPCGYLLTYTQGKPRHIAALHDIKANSLLWEGLEAIEFVKPAADPESAN